MLAMSDKFWENMPQILFALGALIASSVSAIASLRTGRTTAVIHTLVNSVSKELNERIGQVAEAKGRDEERARNDARMAAEAKGHEDERKKIAESNL